MPRRLIVLSLFVVLAGLAPARAAHASPESSAARECSLAGQERKLGPTYVTTLKVTRTSCASAKHVVTAYYRCRVENGGKDGRCRSRVRGFDCTERRFNVIDTQYDARVSCRKDSKTVKHDYTQFT